MSPLTRWRGLVLSFSCLAVAACAPEAALEREPGPALARIEATPAPCLEPGDPSADAYDVTTGPGASRMILPNGRALTPTGDQVRVNLLPLNVISSADGRYVFVTANGSRNNAVQQIEVATRKVVATLTFDDLFHGLALSADGTRLYAAGGPSGEVYAIAVGAPGLTLVDRWNVGGYPSGLALTHDGNRLLVSANLGFEVLELDPTNGAVRRSIETGRLPYQIVISPDDRFAYVSLWQSGGEVQVIDILEGRVVDSFDTSKNPSGLALSQSGDRLFVAAADGDVVELFNTATRRLIERVEVGIFAEGLHGVSPNSLTLSPDGTQLYVANAGDNAIEVYNALELTFLGAMPTGWYPSGITMLPNGSQLVVTNGKGEGAGPNLDGRQPDSLMNGTVSFIRLPLSSSQLAEGEAQVIANNTRPASLHQINCAGKMFPIPAEGGVTPIEHVVILLRENKTYDAYLGDLEVGNGDPDLVLYDEVNTPNTHQLAREFTLLDNFYTDSEESDQGHLWTVAAFVNDYKERTALADRPPDTGVVPASDPVTRYIFDHLWANGIDYVNYGEVVGLGAVTWKNIDLRYPGVFYNTAVKDEKKARYVAERVRSGFMPTFTFMLLPNDHTNGTSPGSLTPEAMVSDNDYAVGLVVDAISKSEFWDRTVIFILQDDPQDGADHVDAHRSPAIVVSPWAKRGYVSSVHYSIPSILRSVGLILDFPPLTQYDALATPLYDCFTATPDYTPYETRPRLIPDEYNTVSTVGAEASMRMDFTGPDRAKGLGRVLWRYLKGTEPPPMFNDGDLEEEAEEDYEAEGELTLDEGLERIQRYAAAEGVEMPPMDLGGWMEWRAETKRRRAALGVDEAE